MNTTDQLDDDEDSAGAHGPDADLPPGLHQLFTGLWNFRVPPPDDPSGSPPADFLSPDNTWFAQAFERARTTHAAAVREKWSGNPIRLVHGSVHGGTPYAWVETPIGLVFDPGTGQLVAAFDHIIVLRTVARVRYTMREAKALAARHGHPGPWPN